MEGLVRGGLLLLLALAAQTAPVEHASIFALEGDTTQRLFTFERTMATADGHGMASVQFRDQAGDVAVTEKVTYKNESVVRHELVQHQVDERYLMTVSGGEAVIEIERNGKTSRTRHDWTPSTLTVDQIRSYITAHWTQLMRDEAVSFRLVALSHARIVGFTLQRQETTERHNPPAVAIRMQASNLFVRWFAPEVDMLFSPDGQTLLESRGPLPVKVKRGNEWVDLDGRMVWDKGPRTKVDRPPTPH